MTERPTPETVDTLRQKLRVAERVKQAAIDCTKSWDNILDELVWERPDIDAHEIPADYLQTMIARYPHHAEALIDFAKRWNSDKPLSDEELVDMEIDEESLKRTTASCLMMLRWSMRIRKAEAERDDALAEAAKANHDAAEICAAAAESERQLHAAREALRELAFSAETSGGTAGRDEHLCAAIAKARSLLGDAT